MAEAKNKDIIFQELLEELADSYGTGSQEGVKASLTECQKIFDCVSISHQEIIADIFELDQKLISAMIRFMPAIKESIVEYEVVCCSGSRCASNGSMEVLRAIKDTLNIESNEVTKDGKIRFTTKNCFKKCGLGPNIMVNGQFHHGMDKTKTIDLMNRIKKNH